MSIANDLATVQESVAQACRDAGRDPAAVRILGACKTMPVDRIRAALDAGQTLLGENRAQDLRDKAPQLATHSTVPEWHFIGRLQRNKVKYVVPWATLIHTVDSLPLAQAIADKAQRKVSALVQVNVGQDPAKAGVQPADALEFCRAVHAMDGIELKGLMTMPPMTDDPDESAPFFAQLAQLAQTARADGLPMEVLSMGMTRDYRVAIAEGSTLIRIGTAIFGARN
jgi:hypothetical protein